MIETPRTDAHLAACLKSGGRSCSDGQNAYWLARQLERENIRLRAIFPKILESLESGACSPDCSVEFMEAIPNEVMLVTKKRTGLNSVILDLLEDLERYPVASVYPDGPCIERDDMNSIKAAIASLKLRMTP